MGDSVCVKSFVLFFVVVFWVFFYYCDTRVAILVDGYIYRYQCLVLRDDFPAETPVRAASLFVDFH